MARWDPARRGWQKHPGAQRRFYADGSYYDVSRHRDGTWSTMYNGPRGAYDRLSPLDGFKTATLAKKRAERHARKRRQRQRG